MPGFIISNIGDQISFNEQFACSYIDKQAMIDGFNIRVHTVDKFQNDKLFAETNDYFIVTEGVLLNKMELLKENKTDSLSELIWLHYKKDIKQFINSFVGNTAGAIYDKKNHTWFVWTNHTADATVFVYHNEVNIVIASQFDYIIEHLVSNKISYTFNRDAAYSMLTYGYMCDNRTYANEIIRLMPGECIEIANNNIKQSIYWKLNKKKYDLLSSTTDEIIDGVDERFRKAVKYEFDKDLEYGYSHVSDMSGGFDARMVTWVAHNMGYSPILNIHYSQSNSNEEKISKQICEYLGHILLIRPLDEISFIYDVDRIVGMNYGLSLYSGITGGESILKALNFSAYGIEHTGMIGDVVIGSFLKSTSETKKKELSGLYSYKLQNKISNEHLNIFKDFELQKVYIRGLLGACSSFMIRKKYTEPLAVFLYPDLLEYCMCVPVELRAKHKLYNEWIIKKYPEAAQFNWTYIDAKITEPSWWVQIKKVARKGSAILLHKLKLRVYRQGMNPFFYWYKTKREYREFYEQYFIDNIEHHVFDDELKKDMIYLFENGTPTEKSQVLTVLSAAKLYFRG